jgi:hypothetical protein
MTYCAHQIAYKGDSLQICSVAANIMNKQFQTAGKYGPPAWWLGGDNALLERLSCCEMLHRASD